MLSCYLSSSPEETQKIAADLASGLKGGEVILLSGGLGAGKTAFTAGLAKGLGIKARVTSPTFTVVNRYTSGRLPLAHFDLYRIHDPEELFELGWDEFLSDCGIVCVEWFALAGAELPPDAILVELSAAEDRSRRITVNLHAHKGVDY